MMYRNLRAMPYLTNKMEKMSLVVHIDGTEQKLEFRLKK